jgi:hypothetical protein
MKVAATFGNLTGNVGRDQQGRLTVGWAGFDECRGFEPVYGFDFGAEPVFTSVRGQFDDGIDRASLTGRGRVDLDFKPGRPLESLPSGM